MKHYCTYFDINYLPRALALYQSMTRHCGEFTLWALCLDSKCEAILRELSHSEIKIISLTSLETTYVELSSVKSQRTKVEYYFTLTPFLPHYIFSIDNGVDLITYIDSDIYFYSSPESLFTELRTNSIAIIEHRFSNGLEEWLHHGKYNVAWISFRRDGNGLQCISWWKDRCIEWCHDYYEDDKFGDQKYLDQWPTLFSGVIVLQHQGANVAPWNVASSSIVKNNDGISVNGDLLIFFHFQGVRRLNKKLYDSGLGHYGAKLTTVLRLQIYKPYLMVLNELYGNLHTKSPTLKTIRVPAETSVYKTLFINLKWWYYFFYKVLLQRNYIIIP